VSDGWVLLVGDSWGCGEIDRDQDGSIVVSHKGVAHYYQGNIINISVIGSSNWEIYCRLHSFLITNTLKIKQVLIVQSEYSRDMRKDGDVSLVNKEWYNTINNTTNITDFEIAVLTKFYSILSKLAVIHDLQFYLIGGVADMLSYPDFNNDFPNLTVVCQSWTNLIITGNPNMQYDRCIYSWYTKKDSTLIDDIKSKYGDVESILNCISKGKERYNLLRSNPEYFYPDGVHPNRKGHKVLFDYLEDNHYL